MRFRRARRAVTLLLLLAGLLGVTTVARAQFQTHSAAASAGGACTTGDFAFPDPSGYALKCIASVWTIVNQPAAAAGSTGYVQFNNSSVLAASSNLFWDNTLFRLGIGTASPVASLDLSQKTDALALPVGTQGQEPASPINGMIRYSTTANDVEAYIAGAWTTLTTGGGSASIFLGSAKNAADPAVNGDTTTGFYTAGSHLVDVSANNTQIMEWSTSGANIVNGSLLMNGANGLSYPVNDTNCIGCSIAIGPSALANLPAMPVGTAFYGNVGIGSQTLSSASMTTAAIDNTAIGQQALYKVTSGNTNTAVGWQAGSAVTSGNANTGVGQDALHNLTTGSRNTGIGKLAGNAVLTGTDNVAVGVNSLYNNLAGTGLSGGNNVALGNFALYDIQSTAASNTALGSNAGLSITTGSNNVAIGSAVASTTLATGADNILIGNDATTDTFSAGTTDAVAIGQGAKAGSGDIAIGYQAYNTPVLDSASNIAIGSQTLSSASMTTSAIRDTAVGYQALKADTSGSLNTGIGYIALANVTTGNSNTAVGVFADGGNSTGSQNTAVGVNTLQHGSSTNNTAVGYFALNYTSGNQNVGIGANANEYATTGTHNVAVGFDAMQGIGTTTPLTGSYNTGLGDETLFNIQGAAASNVAIGSSAATAITTGGSNVVIGPLVASTTLNTGSNNILIGTNSGVDTTSAAASNTLNIGNLIYGTGLASSGTAPAGSVGIGTASPNYLVDIVENSASATPFIVMENPSLNAAATADIDWRIGAHGVINGFISDGYNGTNFYLALGAGWPATETMRLLNGNVGIGTTSPTNILSLGGNAARTIWMERDTTSSTAGQNLTVQAGGANAGGTDLAGGNLVLSSGISTGTRTSNVQFQVYPAAASTASADNTATAAITISETGTVTGGTGSFGNLATTLQTTAASGTDKNGSNLTLATGVSTGTGSSSMNFNVYGAGSTSSNANAATTAMMIASTGYVGIGTTTPQYLVQVGAGNAGISSQLVSVKSSSGTDAFNATITDSSSVGRVATFSNFASGGNTLSLDVGATGNSLGANIIGFGDNSTYRIVWNTSNGSVGIGTTAPFLALQVRTGGLDFGVTGGSTVSGATEIISINDADNTLEPMEIRGSLFDFTGGNVGIGTTVPAYLLHVGSASASGIVVEFQNSSGACTFTPSASSMTPSCSSDRRLKNDIQDTGDALAWLRDMRVRDFTIAATGERKTGVIAQEMLKTHPDMVHLGADSFYKVDEPDPWKLVKAIQELKADNDRFAGSLRAANENIAELRGSFEAYKRAHP